MSYADKIVKVSTDSENYQNENWDRAMELGSQADKRIAELEAENEKLKKIPRCVCGGKLTGDGYLQGSTIYSCEACGTRLAIANEIWEKIKRGDFNE